NASHLIFLAYLVGRPMTEAASILKFNICYIAYSTLLVEKRIILFTFFHSLQAAGLTLLTTCFQ
ncbi:MAG: hypothetical protein ABJJ26_15565, partial [Algoriphagus sp.]|uniref:hypothetical protein n=1 Tax=Algoriphagus sp. TaxID=1872435 RepID=UPI00329856F8